MKRFINILNHYNPYNLVRWIKSVHQKMLSYNMDKDEALFGRNPYQVFQDWLLEIIQYGTVISFTWMGLTGKWSFKTFVILTFATGMARWLWLDIVNETSKSIKET